jgi:hypothetical protein
MLGIADSSAAKKEWFRVMLVVLSETLCSSSRLSSAPLTPEMTIKAKQAVIQDLYSIGDK